MPRPKRVTKLTFKAAAASALARQASEPALATANHTQPTVVRRQSDSTTVTTTDVSEAATILHEIQVTESVASSSPLATSFSFSSSSSSLGTTQSTSSPPPADVPAKSKRAPCVPIACTMCVKKKTRCIVMVPGEPCERCVKSDWACFKRNPGTTQASSSVKRTLSDVSLEADAVSVAVTDAADAGQASATQPKQKRAKTTAPTPTEETVSVQTKEQEEVVLDSDSEFEFDLDDDSQPRASASHFDPSRAPWTQPAFRPAAQYYPPCQQTFALAIKRSKQHMQAQHRVLGGLAPVSAYALPAIGIAPVGYNAALATRQYYENLAYAHTGVFPRPHSVFKTSAIRSSLEREDDKENAPVRAQ